VVEKIMKYFDFMEGKVWHDDPNHVIFNLRIVISYATYIHHAALEIERLENKYIWLEV
jgi:hypothetical protein